MSWPSLPTLVSLLQQEPSRQTGPQASQEATLLEDVAVQFSTKYDFLSVDGPAGRHFSELFDALVTHRLQNATWRAQLRADHLLRCLQCLRLLSRDNTLRRRFVEVGAVQVVTAIFQHEAELHWSGDIGPFQIETLTECTSIIKRLAGEEVGLRALVEGGAHHVLTKLLTSTDPAVLPLVLVALIGFAAHKELYELVAHTNCLEVLLRIVQQYDLPFKRLAADLLALLARREAVVQELLLLNGLGRVVGQLQSGDAHLTQSLLRVVCYMAAAPSALQELYQVGSIPVLLSLVLLVVNLLAANATSNTLPSSRITEMQLVCTALTRLSEDDEMAVQIRSCDGVSLLGKLLLVTPLSSDAHDAQEVAKSCRDVLSLKAYVFRTLRYLFSVERNRKVFKRLFPPDLFAAFIDVGHYTPALAAYADLVTRFEELSVKQQSGVTAALEDISVGREAALRTVRGYVILEMLGKGAFGAVYKARRQRGEVLVALKELPLAEVLGALGATDAERTAGVANMGKEVEILSSLNHPNIVQYYESFTEGKSLYIAMELVEGSSLMDYLLSLADKGRRMPEAEIWQVLIAVSLALSYIHNEKQVVHRDLTPSNIVLGNGTDALRHSKIADFGLAKRLTSSVVAQSMVGTMPYTCPEIIQQEHYTEKADIWSLGCVVYHMMMLHAPFDGTNPLIVASKIVEGSYEALKDPPTGPPYSRQLKQLVGLMMSVDPQRRPNITEVGALMAGPLMSQLGKLAGNEQRLMRNLQQVERSARRAAGPLSEVSSPLWPRSLQRKGSSAAFHDGVSSPYVHPPGSARPLATHTPGENGAEPGSVASCQSSLPRGGLQRDTGGTPQSAGASPSTSGQQRNMVSIATSRLKPVNDPMAQLLQQLHKVMWVEQLPPGLNRDHRRRCIESFRRQLFSAGSNAASVKMHLVKLMGSNNDVICDVSGRPVDFGSMAPLHDALGPATPFNATSTMAALAGTGGISANGDGSMTYDQLHSIIESLLSEKDYYAAMTAAGASSETELLEQLPPPNFNGDGSLGAGYRTAPFAMHGVAASALAAAGMLPMRPSNLGPMR